MLLIVQWQQWPCSRGTELEPSPGPTRKAPVFLGFIESTVMVQELQDVVGLYTGVMFHVQVVLAFAFWQA